MKAFPSRDRTDGVVARHRRQGSTLLETAVVVPIAFLFIIGIIVGGLGVFRCNQLAGLTRECARWATVHGRAWQKSAGGQRPSAADLMSEVILKRAVALDPKQIECDLTWDPSETVVTVQLQYHWIPEAYFSRGVFTSTAVMFVSY